MKKLIAGVLSTALALASACALLPTQVARANVSATTTPYCQRPNAINSGDNINAEPLDGDFVYNASCSVQPGDILTDGLLFGGSFTPTGLSAPVPLNKAIASGRTIIAPAQTFTIAASTTTYLYLSNNVEPTGTWTQNTSATPPANTTLMYTIVSGASTITTITPNYATLVWNNAATFASVQISSLSGTAGRCLVTADTAGTVGASPCPTQSPVPTPSPIVNAPLAVSGVGQPYTFSLNLDPTYFGTNVSNQLTYVGPVPGPQATPSSSPGFGINWAGSYPYQPNLDTTISPTWSGSHAFIPSGNTVPIQIEPTPTAAPTPCPGVTPAASPAPAGALCLGPYAGGTAASTNLGGVVIGKTAGTQWGGTTTANSGPIQLVRNNGSGDFAASMFLSSGGAWEIGVGVGASLIVLNQNTSVAGTIKAEASGNATQSYVAPVFTATGTAINSNIHEVQFSCAFAASGTTCTSSPAWSVPFTSVADIIGCRWLDTNTSPPAGAVIPYNPTTTTISFKSTAAMSTSDVITGSCLGY